MLTSAPLLSSSRLHLRPLHHGDAAFILNLLNQPSFIEFIGDKGVRDEAGACKYLDDGPLTGYQQHGHGLYCVALNQTDTTAAGTPIGMCGLISRAELDAPDLGFAFLPEYWGQGLAYESAALLLPWEAQRHNYTRVLAITSPHNDASGRLLERLGFTYQDLKPMRSDGDPLKFYQWLQPE